MLLNQEYIIVFKTLLYTLDNATLTTLCTERNPGKLPSCNSTGKIIPNLDIKIYSVVKI